MNERERNESEIKNIQINDTVYKTLEDENLYIFAAQVKNVFIGWISAVYIPKVGRTNGRGHLFVDELWVNPNYRKNGIAYELMERVNIVSKELNTLGLRLYVGTENKDAISLYKKCGYEKKNGKAFFMEKECK
jgi:ribosomal protein S18 acetylase RimI-like enzyme